MPEEVVKMRRLISRQPSRKTVGQIIARVVPDPEQSRYCEVCRLLFGSQETRVSVGGKVVHLHCTRRLVAEPE